jgi:thiol-disulfide isomerase/thioredoxin
MQNFYIPCFVRMSELLISLLVVLIMTSAFVFVYKWRTGIYPASKVIVTDPPIEHSGLEPTHAKFMFFYTSWCPHCKTAHSPWNSFKQQLKNNKATYGGYKVIFEDINAEVDVGKSALYKINAYPTFKVETTKKVTEMKGVPDPLTFDQFLINALGPKKLAS